MKPGNLITLMPKGYDALRFVVHSRRERIPQRIALLETPMLLLKEPEVQQKTDGETGLGLKWQVNISVLLGESDIVIVLETTSPWLSHYIKVHQ